MLDGGGEHDHRPFPGLSQDVVDQVRVSDHVGSNLCIDGRGEFLKLLYRVDLPRRQSWIDAVQQVMVDLRKNPDVLQLEVRIGAQVRIQTGLAESLHKPLGFLLTSASKGSRREPDQRTPGLAAADSFPLEQCRVALLRRTVRLVDHYA